MALLPRLRCAVPLALALSACTFHRTERAPWQLRSGAGEPLDESIFASEDLEPVDFARDASVDLPASVAPDEAGDATAVTRTLDAPPTPGVPVEDPPLPPLRDLEPATAPAEAVFAPTEGMQPPEVRDAEWTVPTPVALSHLAEAALLDPLGNALGSVESLLIDPESGAVVGALAASRENEREPVAFVPYDGFLDHDEGSLVLTAEAAAMLAADRRELATAALFKGRELETCEGVIGEGEVVDEDGLRVFTLTDDNNHRHRVLFAPLSVTKAVPLEAGQRARLEALRTRDENGPLLITAWIGIEDFELRLRDQLGRATWSREMPRGWSYANLCERKVRVDGRLIGQVEELLIRFHDGTVEAVRIAGGERTVHLPWDALRNVDGAGLEVDAAAWELALAAPDETP